MVSSDIRHQIEMYSHRKLFSATKPVNVSVCTDDLCVDSDCPFDDCSSYADPSSSSSSSSSPPHPTADQPLQLSPLAIVVIALLSTLIVLVSYYFIVVKLCSNCLILRRQPPPLQQNASEENGQVQGGAGDGQTQIDHPIWLINTVGLQQSVINSITVVKYRRGERLIEGTDCSVCLSEFQEDETLRLLPKCNHAFHIGCIDTWLRSHTNCPMCRAFIMVSSIGAPSLAANHQSFGDSRRNEMDRIVDVEINEVELANNDNANGEFVESRVGTTNNIEVLVVDDRDQIKAEMSSVPRLKLLRRCVSMGYLNLYPCTVHGVEHEHPDPSYSSGCKSMNSTEFMFMSNHSFMQPLQASHVSIRRSHSSGARLYR